MSTRSKEYWVWSAMMQRCTNPKNKAYKNYGGRGINVCEKWRSFKGFAEDMLPRPPGAMLDRINNDEGYSPENCRWTDRKTQNSNRRNCIYVQHGGKQITLKERCRQLGISYGPVVKRVQDRGWSLHDALTIPVGASRRTINMLRTANDKETQ